MVFPIGMYGVASHELGTVTDIALIRRIGDVEAWVALPVWTLTFVAMIWSWIRPQGSGAVR
ncbi:MAG TPA: hypothetical protein VNC80_03360 [Mycobacteriales bacterium]|nr:hypothetical protein [Mycobacteriales bacterium]